MKTVPGTVSEILWHFTGGPAWDTRKQVQGVNPKSAFLAYNALIAIFESSELRVGTYKESVKVSTRTTTSRGHRGPNRVETIESLPVCCLADIPIAHLAYHARRYGKFAIGFHRHAVLKSGFNPVLYAMQRSRLVRTIHKGFAGLHQNNFKLLGQVVEDVGRDNLMLQLEHDFATAQITQVRKNLGYVLAFVKTFQRKEFATIYAEREWRSIRPFRFKSTDIAMVVVPKCIAGKRYFDRFVKDVRPRLRLPSTVPVVPWEYLVET